MDTMQIDDEIAPELDDSGCVQDDSYLQRSRVMQDSVELLDLSDDVLLCILEHCSPRDLKALGFSCSRFSRLVLERSLWRRVDFRDQPCGRARLRWLVTHALHADTTQLLLAGYAREAAGCLGHLNEADKGEESPPREIKRPSSEPNLDQGLPHVGEIQLCTSGGWLRRHHALFHISVHQLPRFSIPAYWPEEVENEEQELKAEDLLPADSKSTCKGPWFTLSTSILTLLRQKCPNLSTLGLEYCNINCKTTGIGQLPSTLRSLSLRGSKCFNVPMDKSFLFKIQDHLPKLESLDVSECEWMEPSALLPLSKLQALRRLLVRDCARLSEFVAYASLATRYGFRELVEFDLRGSPVSDSEVSALGWLPALQVLQVSAAAVTPLPTHTHTKPGTAYVESAMDDWELQEPEFFKSKLEDVGDDEQESNVESNTEGDQLNSEAEQRKEDGQVTKENVETVAGADGAGASSSKESSDGNHSTKRKPRDDAPSCSKRKRTDGEPDDGESSDSDYEDRDDGIITVVRKGNRLETERKRKSGRNLKKSSLMKIISVMKHGPKEPKKKSKADKSVNDGAGTSRDKSRMFPGFICIQGDGEPGDGEPGDRQEHLHPRLRLHPPQHLQPAPWPMMRAEQQIHRALYLSQIMVNFPGEGDQSHLDAAMLVSDASVRRFGRASDENINYVNIGQHGPIGDNALRPDRSSLRRLTMRGYRHVTDRSLVHLATSAPDLVYVDFRGTGVTATGVESFRAHRPDCEVLFGDVKQ